MKKVSESPKDQLNSQLNVEEKNRFFLASKKPLSHNVFCDLCKPPWLWLVRESKWKLRWLKRRFTSIFAYFLSVIMLQWIFKVEFILYMKASTSGTKHRVYVIWCLG